MTERSVQTRCPRMEIHPPGGKTPYPCSECYSIEITSRRLPEWEPEQVWHTVEDETPRWTRHRVSFVLSGWDCDYCGQRFHTKNEAKQGVCLGEAAREERAC